MLPFANVTARVIYRLRFFAPFLRFATFFLATFRAFRLGAFFVAADKPAEKLELDPEFEPECWRIVGSRSHGASRLETFAECLPEYRNVPMGSSLKLCMVAANRSDLYVRFGPTSEWDTAAAQAIVEAAGGKLVDADTLEPLRYNQREDLTNPFFYVVGDPNFPLHALNSAV